MMTTNVSHCQEQKKAAVVQHPQVFDHVGLLANEPPGHGRVALHQVIQHVRGKGAPPCAAIPPLLQ
jgi:hypothetical protein